MNIKEIYSFLCEQDIEDVYDATCEIVRKIYAKSYYGTNGTLSTFGFNGEYKSLTYVLYDGTYCKIGKVLVIRDGKYREYAINERIKTLQIGNPRRIMPLLISYEPEASLHKMFKKKKLSVNEWFDLSDQDFDNILDKSIRVDKWLKVG